MVPVVMLMDFATWCRFQLQDVYQHFNVLAFYCTYICKPTIFVWEDIYSVEGQKCITHLKSNSHIVSALNKTNTVVITIYLQ
jgi:hypothetical protein